MDCSDSFPDSELFDNFFCQTSKWTHPASVLGCQLFASFQCSVLRASPHVPHHRTASRAQCSASAGSIAPSAPPLPKALTGWTLCETFSRLLLRVFFASTLQEGGVPILTAILESSLDVQWKEQYECVLDLAAPPISLEASQRITEILKILFTVTYSTHKQEPSEVS